ncbi:MAG: hypothetical protein J6W03_09125 [Bacteroidaceae bacterium]|nr:hypothetical protein [Bacteroidaceae bacterium]
MKNHHIKRLFSAIFMLVLLAACTENIDTSARYVFQTKTITEYLEEKDYYSEYVRLLGEMKLSNYSETTLKQLLSARGHYTVFAPTNDAIQLYLDSLFRKGIISEASWEGFKEQSTLDSIRRVIVFNSILDSGDQPAYDISDFPENEHEFSLANMNNRKLRIFYGQLDLDSISIDGVATISKKNRGIVLSNGYVHQVEGVVAPSDARLGDFMRMWAKQTTSGYTVMSKLLLACGMEDTLNAYRDEQWEFLYQTSQVKDLPNHTSVGQKGTIPRHRYYGFTLFAETDRFWEETLGKSVEEITVDDVCNYLRESGLFDYIPGTLYDEDYENQMNVLNQFVTYHLLPQRIGREKLVIHYNELGYNYTSSKGPSIPIMDYYQTMGLPRLIKTYESAESHGIYLNRFPRLRNGRGQYGPAKLNINDYHESGEFPRLKGSCTTPNETEGIRVLTSSEAGTDPTSVANAVVYPLEQLLVCTENVSNQMGSERIRIDAGCMLPELMNNDIRAQRAYYPYGATNVRAIPTNYPYLDGVQIREGTQFYYLQGYMVNYHNLQADEYNIIGRYDFTMRLPPVPRAGQYEIRFGVATGSRVRSMAQVYFGTSPDRMPAAGIPMDLRVGGKEKRMEDITMPSDVGWEEDTDDDEYNDRVTKAMRAKGFMKAPNSWTNGTGGSTPVRTFHYMTRRILLSTYLQPYQNYYIRFQSVLDAEAKEFYMDYFEFVPKEVYDNPEEPEDIW